MSLTTLTADKFKVRAPDGTVMVSIGKIEDKPVYVSHLYHFTREVEYVDGCLLTDTDTANLSKMATLVSTYEGCQTWVYAGMWYTIPAAGLCYSRWDPVNVENVPECVRMAEIMRGV